VPGSSAKARGRNPPPKIHFPHPDWQVQIAGWLVLLNLPVSTLAQGTTNVTAGESARVSQLYEIARTNYQTAHTNAAFAWQFGRACFDRAEFATNSTERALLAEQGIAACRPAVAATPDTAEPHYYLAMNLGQLARTKMLGAFKLVSEMETEFKAARGLDERLDFAGPDRNLGLLYFEAPGWPTSIGSRSKARHHLRRAVELAPQHPENRLCLLEACLHWGDRNGAQRELKALAGLWPAARTNLVGEAWTAAWTDWERRLKQAKTKFEKPPNTLAAPHQNN
jgi:hypothetical protein